MNLWILIPPLKHWAQKGKKDSADKLDRHKIFIALVFAYEMISLPIIMRNSENIVLTVFLAIALILVFVNHFIIAGKVSVFYLIIPFIQVLSIIAVDLLAESSEYKIIILIVVVSILNEYPIAYSRKFALFPLILYMGVSVLFMIFVDGESYATIGVYVIRNSIIYVLVVGTFYIGRKQILLNNQLKDMTRELRENNRKLEEISIVKERNRIAREIHDTLGHTLTGAIIQLEAAKKLIDVDRDKTLEAIEKTQKITREGFMEVKRAIQALRPVLIEEGNLKDSLEALFEKTENDFQVSIESRIFTDELRDKSMEVSLYRIIQESITNSIRHGDATKIKILLENRMTTIELSIIDNGKGCSAIHEGFGLRGIKERINGYLGHVQIISNPNEGFQLQATIPKN